MKETRARKIIARARRTGLTGRVIGKKYSRGKGRSVIIDNGYGLVVTSRYEVANDWIKARKQHA